MKLENKWLPWLIKWSEPLVRPQQKHKRLLWKHTVNFKEYRYYSKKGLNKKVPVNSVLGVFFTPRF